MELATFVVEAVLVEGRSVREVARAHGVSKTWLYELLARYRAEGEAGLIARSKRPHRSPTRVPETVEDEIIAIRKHLVEFGVEAGPDTIPRTSQRPTCGRSVLSLERLADPGVAGSSHPSRTNGPRALRPLQAALPNECWQMDVTHVLLKNGRSVEVLNVIDDTAASASPARAFRSRPPLDRCHLLRNRPAYGFPASVLRQRRHLHRLVPR